MTLLRYWSGLGMSIISFDWAQIAYIGSPLATPWWAEANVTIGFAVFFCTHTYPALRWPLTLRAGILTPIIYVRTLVASEQRELIGSVFQRVVWSIHAVRALPAGVNAV